MLNPGGSMREGYKEEVDTSQWEDVRSHVLFEIKQNIASLVHTNLIVSRLSAIMFRIKEQVLSESP
jgi:hypothetical protein